VDPYYRGIDADASLPHWITVRRGWLLFTDAFWT
jgi:hypothetical protein